MGDMVIKNSFMGEVAMIHICWHVYINRLWWVVSEQDSD